MNDLDPEVVSKFLVNSNQKSDREAFVAYVVDNLSRNDIADELYDMRAAYRRMRAMLVMTETLLNYVSPSMSLSQEELGKARAELRKFLDDNREAI